MIDDTPKEKTQDYPQSSPNEKILNFQILMDLYKHHWDLFLKGFAFYLLGCSIVSGYTVSQHVEVLQQYFCGAAISGASVFAFWGTNVSQKWLKHVVSEMQNFARKYDILVFKFDGPIQILNIMRGITIVIFACGIIYLANVFSVHKYGVQLPDLFAAIQSPYLNVHLGPFLV